MSEYAVRRWAIFTGEGGFIGPGRWWFGGKSPSERGLALADLRGVSINSILEEMRNE